MLVDALSGFIPEHVDTWLKKLVDVSLGAPASLASDFIVEHANPWINKFERHPVETVLIVTAIALSLAGSGVLQMRIHDRARLAWHENYRSGYAEWLSQAQKGWRRRLQIAFVIAVAALLLSFAFGAADSIKLELGIAAGVLSAIYGLGYLGRRFVLSLARRLRTSSLLGFLYRLLFNEVVPVAFTCTS